MQKPDVSLRYNFLGAIQVGFFVTVSLTNLELIRKNTSVFAVPAPGFQSYAPTLGLVAGSKVGTITLFPDLEGEWLF